MIAVNWSICIMPRLLTENVEPVFNRHPALKRSALVGVGEYGRQKPVLCLELDPAHPMPREALFEELRQIARTHRHTQHIDTFLVHPGFPVDIRHNAKIGREQLAAWAAKELRWRR